MKKNKIPTLPKISIVIVTLNVEKKLPKTLQSIEIQDYPRNKLEIIAVDGGSTDKTIAIFKKNFIPVKIIRGKYPDNQEARRGVGLKYARGEIVAYIDADNYLPHKKWLKKMITPFLIHPEIVGSFTLRYGYRRKDSILNRYFALLGSGDPVDFYLRKGERLSYLYDKWNRYGTIFKNYKDYFLIKFEEKFFPTLGANGFLVRKNIWKKGSPDPSRFVHVDVPYDLVKLGFNTYAIVDDEIIHDTAESFFSFLKKRIKYILFYQYKIQDRSYKVFDIQKKEDVWNLLLFILFSLTIVQPLVFAIRGFIKKRDVAWFVHPLYCFIITFWYSSALLFRLIKKMNNKSKN